MGVHGLWRLIEPSGKPVPLETLENKVLAVDVSIWLHQAIKGFQDSKGESVPNAHLLSIYHRLCKLLYFKIKPIFVFDGGVPVLKRQTIAKRNQLKVKNVSEADNIQKQLLTVLLKHTAVSKVITEKIEASLANIPKIPSIRSKKDDLFMLPPLSESFDESLSSENDESFSTTTTSDDNNSPSKKNWDLHTIEVNSQQFKSLPVDVRHEILTELKGTRKQSSWDRLYELPKESDGFSEYQMKRLLKRQSVQNALEDAEKEMGGKSLSLAELESLLSDQGVIGNEKIIGRRIASDENKKYLLVKDVKKAMEEAKIRENIPLETHLVKETIKVDSEEEEDLKKAIALSLECKENSSNETKKMRNTPFSLNKESNDADLSISSSEDEEIPAKICKTIAENEIMEIMNKNLKSDQKKELSKISNLEVVDDNDENLIEQDLIEIMSTSEDSEQEREDKGINIVVDSNNKDFNKEDDLFADIFEENNEITHSPPKDKLVELIIINEEKNRAVIEMPENSSINESSQKLTDNDLKTVKTNLENDIVNLQKEKSSKERLGVNITDQMYQETQELLELFGVPYVIAPMEAEAQCAFLEKINLTNGTITDDSDIWLFGGRTVYKNFFNQKQYVMEFKSKDIQHSFKLTRKQMILLALLVGSDYTVGLSGIGPVTAMEILGTFPCSNLTTIEDENNNAELLIAGLKEFRSWFLKGKSSGPGRNSLKTKLKNLQFSENFPNLNVVQAYLNPQIETSKETFSWGKPHELALIEYARDKFGWTKLKTEELLKPVLKKLNDTQFQKSIKDYFKTDFQESAKAEKKMSKRVKSAISNIGKDPIQILEEDLKKEIKRNPQKRKLKDKTLAPEFVIKETNEENKFNSNSIEDKIDTIRQRRQINQGKAKKIDLKKLKVTSKILADEDAAILAKTIEESTRKVNEIEETMKNNLEKLDDEKPSTSRQSTRRVFQHEPIPQKNKQEATLLRNKLKAIEIFRKEKNGPGYVQKTEKKKRLPKETAELSN